MIVAGRNLAPETRSGPLWINRVEELQSRSVTKVYLQLRAVHVLIIDERGKLRSVRVVGHHADGV